MSARSGIVTAFVEKLKEVDGSGNYKTNFNENVSRLLKFWDEVNDFPFVCVSAGYETREYLPAEFTWGYLTLNVKVYVRDEFPIDSLEAAIHDIELVTNNNRQLEYEEGKFTTEILITSIVTDEGLLAPIGVGDININVRYQVV